MSAGTRVMMNNVTIKGFEEGIDMDDDETGVGVTSGKTKISNIKFDDVTKKLKNDTNQSFTEGDLISGDGAGTGTNYSAWSTGWTRS